MALSLPLMSAIFLIFAFLLAYVEAQQFSRAECPKGDSSNAWMLNMRQQDPCEVASSLLSACVGHDVYLPPLTGNGSLNTYSSFQVPGDGPCRCSSVYYAIVSACAFCQRGNWDRWAQQTASCPASSIQRQFLVTTIPPTTQVPSWAYLDYVAAGTFNPTTARLSVGISPGPPPTSDLADFTMITATRSDIDTNTLPPMVIPSTLVYDLPVLGPESPDERDKETKAVVGGVIGGFAVIAAVVVYIIWRNKRNRTTYIYRTSAETGDIVVQSSSTKATPETAVNASSVNHQINRVSLCPANDSSPTHDKDYQYTPPLSSLHIPQWNMGRHADISSTQ